ncbi:hypothetical protein [Paenarthrobacter nitroguajacolicus]|uniref:hypothetical protein n=1 Tax=Paenarthrobacter nitroguajacolicus TaxID=211146 RepID=UPI0015B90289|nr:hypothetical protein [Paenarthrobacter nitroguajacolicus]NWL32733.1 hypothetical protein [Paenarthrobacter nitroguajacolicus]
MIALIVCFSLASIAGVIIVIWNLRAMRGSAPQPMKAAIVVSLVSIVLLMTFIDGALNDPGKIGLPVLHAFVAAWTVGILRLKKVPTRPAVAV